MLRNNNNYLTRIHTFLTKLKIMKNLKLFSILVVFAAILIIGCSKGSVGPAGPAGDASVLHSAWVSLVTPYNATDSDYEEALNASAITSTIVDSGVVLSFIGIPGGAPNGTDTAVFTLADASSFIGPATAEFYVGGIYFYSLNDYTGLLYRYVIIPGSALTNSAFKQYTKAQLKTMPYSTVQKLLGTATVSSNPTN
jgi:hypothetical protein